MTQDILDTTTTSASPFEGPEKLLEIWFASSADEVKPSPDYEGTDFGLRAVPRAVWEEMLDIVKCKVLSYVRGSEIDAYLLSESSFFVWPHKLILKTCGTTLNLLGLPRILHVASLHAGLRKVYRCFYSRKSFMFPERQLGPHRDWKFEVDFLDRIFKHKYQGGAYTVGKVNGDHWLLYITCLDEDASPEEEKPLFPLPTQDYTIEILMTNLSPAGREPFTFPSASGEKEPSPSDHAQQLSTTLGISSLFPPHLTTLDAYSFDPCGYSANALLKWTEPALEDGNSDVGGEPRSGEGYYTIHVTPEEGYSYASFECNVPLSTRQTAGEGVSGAHIPDLETLIRRVVRIFEPGTLSVTLFMSSSDYQDAGGNTEVELAQQAFKSALDASKLVNGCPGKSSKGYRRTNKINYEFSGYDLAFASFEKR